MKSPPEREKKLKGTLNSAANKGRDVSSSGGRGVSQGAGENFGIAGDLIGREIGHYRLLKLIGEGATAVVYLAEDYKLERKCAIKILHPMIAKRPGIKDRFLREAKMAAKLKHENIIVIHDFDIDEKLGPFIVMELLEGYSLHQLLEKEGALSLDRSLKIGEQICSAMEAAHSQGIIHRDLKPENVFIVPRQEKEIVKIVDFGLARLTEGASAITGEGKLIGTPLYMSPEQCRGEKNLTPATDIYSFGIMLYEMLTGETPFKGEHPHKLLIDHLLSTPPDLPPSFPEPLRILVRELLAKKPEERPKSFREVQLRLRDAVVITEPEVNKEPTQPRAYNPYIPPPPSSPGVKNTPVVRGNKASSTSSIPPTRDLHKLPTEITPYPPNPLESPRKEVNVGGDSEFLVTNPDIPTGEYLKIPPPESPPVMAKKTDRSAGFFPPTNNMNLSSQEMFSPVEKTPPRSMSGVRSVVVKRSNPRDKRSKDKLLNDLEQLFSNNPPISPESSMDTDSSTVWDLPAEGIQSGELLPEKSENIPSVSYENYNQLLYSKPELYNNYSQPMGAQDSPTSPNLQPHIDVKASSSAATEFDMRAPTELFEQLEAMDGHSTTPEQLKRQDLSLASTDPQGSEIFLENGTETELSTMDYSPTRTNRWWLWLFILLLMGLAGLFFYSQLLPLLSNLEK